MRFQQADGPTLSQVLRELKSQTPDDVDHRQSTFDINFAQIFEQYQGMVHLEGLEILSDHCRQMVTSKQRIDATTRARLANIESFYDHFDETGGGGEHDDCECLRRELDVALSRIALAFSPTKLYAKDEQIHASIDRESTPDSLHRVGIESLAAFTSLSIESLHKMGQLQLIALTMPNVDAYRDYVLILCGEVSTISNKFSECMNDGDETTTRMLTSLFLEANNCVDYIKQAFVLLRYVFQRAIIDMNHRNDYGID